jgi:hypothetical protein
MFRRARAQWAAHMFLAWAGTCAHMRLLRAHAFIAALEKDLDDRVLRDEQEQNVARRRPLPVRHVTQTTAAGAANGPASSIRCSASSKLTRPASAAGRLRTVIPAPVGDTLCVSWVANTALPADERVGAVGSTRLLRRAGQRARRPSSRPSTKRWLENHYFGRVHVQDLPPAARAYLERSQQFTGVAIAYVPVGTRRDRGVISLCHRVFLELGARHQLG